MISLFSESTMCRTQAGALLVATLLILLVVSILGMATLGTSGLELQMASNSRAQQQAFEAAEFTLAWVEQELQSSDLFSSASLAPANCAAACFTPTCRNGYCFDGAGEDEPVAGGCTLSVPVSEFHAAPDVWAEGSARHRTLAEPGGTARVRYIVEYLCYTAWDHRLPYDAITNSSRMFRITAYAVSEGGRARVMLRSTLISVCLANSAPGATACSASSWRGRVAWEQVEIPF